MRFFHRINNNLQMSLGCMNISTALQMYSYIGNSELQSHHLIVDVVSSGGQVSQTHHLHSHQMSLGSVNISTALLVYSMRKSWEPLSLQSMMATLPKTKVFANGSTVQQPPSMPWQEAVSRI